MIMFRQLSVLIRLIILFYFSNQDAELWEERPFDPDLLESAMRDVSYLLDLRVATLRRLMGELMCATHIYLTSVRDTADSRGSKGQVSIIGGGVANL